MKRIEAAADGADNAEVLLESALALKSASEKAWSQAEQIAAQAPFLIILGITLILAVKVVQGLIANKVLKSRFQRWRADQSLPTGVDQLQILLTGAILFCRNHDMRLSLLCSKCPRLAERDPG